ncbi:glycosyltransferase family 4 protein [Chryseobacterium aquaticum]|uniref:Glycosyl transferase family 1 domain-containing protein n=2 Tax=Chryseobacterium aquaticum TaxID=452084 RepID=A0A101CL73_9FLAO|nr:glycosyltransferase family 4 protein [Chryseobacterium aquaticum]KQK27498.1 hypothetical protein AR438_00145 [Chryseobacterium aquaticum]KUJ58253.1 hypothetical protein AR686_00130 [Chryseobacterium aquaticum subsp. greenlandense]
MTKIIITTTGLSSTGQTGGISSYVHDLATNLSNNFFDVYVFLVKEEIDSEPVDINYKFKYFNVPSSYKNEEILIDVIYNDILNLNPNIIINNNVSYIAGLWPVFPTDIIKISIMHGFSHGISFSNSSIIGKIAVINHNYLDYVICQNSKMLIDVNKKYNVPIHKLKYVPQCFKNDQKVLKESDGSEIKVLFANGKNKTKGSGTMKKLYELLHKSTINFKLWWCMVDGKYPVKKSEDVIFYGSLSRFQFIEKMSKSDIVIIPTQMDTGPMLVVEALANGTIPICNNLKSSAIPDLIEDGYNGFKIKNNSSRKYLETIKLISQDPMLLINIKKNARLYYLNNLTEKHQIKYFTQLFNKNTGVLEQKEFSEDHIIFNHLKITSKLSIFSFKRLLLKIFYTLELPLQKSKFYTRWL